MPLVSVIMPCRNAAPWLDHSIRSVRAQDFQDWEMLVADDASTDNSAQLIGQHARDDARIQLLRLSQRVGSAGARNHALQQARGRFMAFLDADDWWCEKKLSSQLTFIQRAGAPLSYTAYEKANAEGQLEGRVFYPPPAIDYAAHLLDRLLNRYARPGKTGAAANAGYSTGT
ncbi:MAG: glycosyltransferase family 2 protein [Alphaproteobacteria bacterium]|nr:glycosyltransferase family 2 protein [Alphaproteobacteria bacterium]